MLAANSAAQFAVILRLATRKATHGAPATHAERHKHLESTTMFSILHISDLHRSADDPISNDELVASLSTDRARYARSEPAIRAPDAIVISGDIIQGVLLGDSAGKHSLSEQ